MTLQEILDDPAMQRRFVSGGERVIEEEVASKRGLTGMAIKGGFKAVKAIKPGIVPGALEQLLPAFAPAVEPHYQTAQRQGDIPAYFTANAREIADALLKVTDAKAERAQNAVMKRTYRSLRGQALEHTAAAMPRVGQLLADLTP